MRNSPFRIEDRRSIDPLELYPGCQLMTPSSMTSAILGEMSDILDVHRRAVISYSKQQQSARPLSLRRTLIRLVELLTIVVAILCIVRR